MAILWKKLIDGTQYEVRAAGETRRLYTDGVFHSQFNPKRAITGGIWDLLFLPALFYPKQEIKRVLVLGVGGGAVIHQLHRYVKPTEIVGIELNPIHLKLAKRYFGLDNKLVNLIESDAITWLGNYSGPAFDLIIEDVFKEENGEPVRVAKANKSWLEKLNSHLSPEGLLIMNFISSNELKNCAAVSYKKTSSLFASMFQLTMPNYDNAIGAFLKKSSTSQVLRKHVSEIKGLKNSKNLNFNVRKLK